MDTGVDQGDRARSTIHPRHSENEDRAGTLGQRFAWGVGIESSTIPHLDVDQFEWTHHNTNWREDLKLAAQGLGVTHLRYAIPWSYLEPRRGSFDWSVADERINACHDLGLELMMDVMHFGTPRWLPQAVGDPEFPESLEQFTTAMVERYRDRVKVWCPVNEPLVTSLFSGDFGFWPPHGRKWRGYMPVLSRVALATSRAVRAARRAQPEATILLCDAADQFKTRDDSLRGEVALRNLRRFLLLDLIGGRVDANHPLHEWVSAYGMSELDLQWFRTHPQMPDIIGLDYYPHSDWELEMGPTGLRQRRADSAGGLYGVASDYYNRYGLPMLVTETSIEGKPINREIWLDRIVEEAKSLRADGVPLVGIIWWPLFDHLDWDGAMTHRIGKLHEVGLYKLARQGDGSLRRIRTPLATAFAALAAGGDAAVGSLETVAVPAPQSLDELPPLADFIGAGRGDRMRASIGEVTGANPKTNGDGNGNGHPGRAAGAPARAQSKSTDHYGIIVFSHLRWGFVWQRPQQFLSRFARQHPVLFLEEPMFDQPEGGESRVELHHVMPNLTVACPHCAPSWRTRPDLPVELLKWSREAIEQVNDDGAFDRPLLWYYSPMDSAWSLGELPARGVVYDCMDELSQFNGAPPSLVQHEARLIKASDIVFTGGRNLFEKKRKQHDNVHFFGCGVEADHFGQAMDPATAIPPDIDFMNRPILGWFGVIDERVDYHLVGEMARLRPQWSFAMVGPIVKVDPNVLPHAPNLFWMGGRDYSVLPNYCRAFDVCMMCFAINDATEYINPTKALEYLATGKPVISTPVKDVVAQYSDLIDIAATPHAFVEAADRALSSPDRQRIDRGLERARQSTWEATVQAMRGLIKEGIAPPQRPSAATVAPVQNAGQYEFVSTPGS